ncbi:hypothetical protein [Mycoplasma sp. CSL10166]|uniref:YobI family P-loop NTPase n=1 Tax=Mycoplasma sp. CSL10166 TaxID=2813825 RepID=UPI00197B3F6C|nr:hypothetical protein [Mycoplasma sp. CSL10166]MBN4084186.1 hypothetical protein [Mycoplasma sp. CSL10166]
MSKEVEVISRSEKTQMKVLVGNFWLELVYLSQMAVNLNVRHLKEIFLELINLKINYTYSKWENLYKWYINFKNIKCSSKKHELCEYCKSEIKNNSNVLESIILDEKNQQNALEIIIYIIELIEKYIIYEENNGFHNNKTKTFLFFIQNQFLKESEEITFKIEEYFKNYFIHSNIKTSKDNNSLCSNFINTNNRTNELFIYYILNKLLINLDLMLNTHWINLVVDYKNIIFQKEDVFVEKSANNIDAKIKDYSNFIYVDPNLIIKDEKTLDVKSFIFPFESIDLDDLDWTFVELKKFMLEKDSFDEKFTYKLDKKEEFSNVESINYDEIVYFSKHLASEVERKNIKNILITGEAMSGKSSVLNLFLKNKNTDEFIKISFNNINYPDLKVSDQQTSENSNKYLLEKSLARQIIYQLGENSFIGNKIVNKNKKRTFFISLASFVISTVSTPFLLKTFYKFDYNINSFFVEISKNLLYNSIFIFLLWFLLFGIIFVSLFMVNKNLWRLRSIKIKGNEINLHTNATFLDANLDAIVDIILNSNKKIIVFEDINKKNNSNFLPKLFEINNLLNLKEISNKYTFIYVIDSEIVTEKFKTRFFDSIIDVKNNFNSIDKKTISAKIKDKITTEQSKKISNTIYPQFESIQKSEIDKIVNDYIYFFINWKEINLILKEISSFERITKNLFIKNILEDKNLFKNNILNLYNHIQKRENLFKLNKYLEDFVFLWIKIKDKIVINPKKKEKYVKLQDFMDKSLYIPKNIFDGIASEKAVDELSDDLVAGFSQYISFYKRDEIVKKSLIRFTFFKFYLVYLISSKFLEHYLENNRMLEFSTYNDFIDVCVGISKDIKNKNNQINDWLKKQDKIFARLIIKELLYISKDIKKENLLSNFNSPEFRKKIKFILYFVFDFPELKKSKYKEKFKNKMKEAIELAIKSFINKHSIKYLTTKCVSEESKTKIKQECNKDIDTHFKSFPKEILKLLRQLIYDGYISENYNAYMVASKIDYTLEENSDICFEIDHIFDRKVNLSFLLRDTKKCFHIDLNGIYDIFDDSPLEQDKFIEYFERIEEFLDSWLEVNERTRPSFEMIELDKVISKKFENLFSTQKERGRFGNKKNTSRR